MLMLSFLLGVVAWTFLEYVLHRFLGHVHKGKNFFKAEHLLHHSKANYFAPVYKKAMAASVVAGFVWLLLALLSDMEVATGFTSGLMLMYGFYEFTHYRYHAARPLPPFLFLRKHHFYHHFHDPKKNHGVTTRFWDRVFGTYVSVESEVKMPKQMAPQWLFDEQNHQLRPQYQAHFKIVGR